MHEMGIVRSIEKSRAKYSPLLTTVLVSINCIEPIFKLLGVKILWIFRVYREQNVQ
jgi:hypothetical protein